MTNQPGDIRMFVHSEPYQVECNGYLIDTEFIYCRGTGKLTYDDGQDSGLKCRKCKGTGKRTVRLAGWVKVENWSTERTERYVLRPENKGILGRPDVGKEYAKQILHWHRVRVLPKEYYKSDDNPMGLEETPCDT